MTSATHKVSGGSSATSSRPATETARRRLIAGAVGSFVEWYDFLVYGLSTPILATLFFPNTKPTAAILSTLAIFGVAFLVRPVGGVIFGYFGDKYSRVKVLSFTVLLMGAGTTLLGLLPTYSSIGIAATLLLVLCRVLQGLSAGGEHSGAMAYVVESAPDDRRARWIGYVFSATFLPSALGAALILGLQTGLGSDAYNDWAWRIPFLIGGVLAVFGLYLRLKLSDPEEFVEANEGAPRDASPVKAASKRDIRTLFTVMFLVPPSAVATYLLVAYMYTFMVQRIGIDRSSALLSNAVVSVAVVVMVPAFGMLADKVGRKPLMFAGAGWLAVMAYPAMYLVSMGNLAAAYAGQLLLAIGIAAYAAGSVVAMVELFRTSVRFSGHALAYSLGAALSGLTPLVAGALVDQFGSLAPSYYVATVAVVGLIVVTFTPETRLVVLRTGVASGREDEAGSASEAMTTNEVC